MTEEERQQSHDQIVTPILIQAWIDSRMELDKTYITLSGGGIGLLTTLMVGGWGIHSLWEFSLFGLSILLFVLSIVQAIFIYKENPEEIERVYHKIQVSGGERIQNLDKTVFITFLAGLLFAVCGGVVSGLQVLSQKQGDQNKTAIADQLKSIENKINAQKNEFEDQLSSLKKEIFNGTRNIKTRKHN